MQFNAPVISDDTDKWIVIYDDPIATPSGPNVISDPVQLSGTSKTVVWNDQGEIKPAAYVSGCTGNVSLKFSSPTCQIPELYIKLIYEVPDNEGDDVIFLNWTQATLDLTTQTYIVESANISYVFPEEKVFGEEDFKLTWKISEFGGEDIGILAGYSSHPFYLTYKKSEDLPFDIIGSETYPIIYHTYLFISCIAATNIEGEEMIFNKIYDEFEDQKVNKYNESVEMGYWREPVIGLPNQGVFGTISCVKAGPLIAYNNATCGSWADLLFNLGSLHGITDLQIVNIQWKDDLLLDQDEFDKLKLDAMNFFQQEMPNVYWDPNNLPWTGAQSNDLKPTAMFFVNDWKYPALRGFYAEYVLPEILAVTLVNGNKVEGADELGLKGQGNDNPRADFENHSIVAYGNKLYDPSYGTNNNSIVNEIDYENVSIHSFGAKIFFYKLINGSVEMFDIIWPIELNTASPQLIFTYIN